jgi:heme/copper-type cytochrome/quinol oxidase subunit 2
MNKKQMIVLWVVAILLCMGLVFSTYEVWYKAKPKPNTLDALLIDDEPRGWTISKLNRLDRIGVNMIRYLSPILIIGGVLLYSLRNKNKQ